MLGKLIKHDYRSLSKTLWPAQLAIVCATLIATGSVAAYMSWTGGLPNESALVRLAQIILVIVPVVMLLGIIAAAFVVAFIIFNRFYKNLMGDEGYLSFTLPVTAANHLWAKLINAVIWLTISTVVITLCVMFFIFVSSAIDSGDLSMFFSELREGIRQMREFWDGRYTLIIVESIILCLVSAASEVLHIYLSITIGSLVAKKHKILASIGFYFLISIASGILTSVISFGTTYAFDSSNLYIVGGPDGVTQTTDAIIRLANIAMLSTTAIMAVLAAVYFIFTHYLLKNKLNLD